MWHAIRQTTGVVQSLLGLVGLDWARPDFSTLCRGQQTLHVSLSYRGSMGPLNLLIPYRYHAAHDPAGQWISAVSPPMVLMTSVNTTKQLRPEMPIRPSSRARTQSPENRRVPEQSPATMPSMRNEIWAAPFGDAGVDSTAEAASKRRVYENSWPIDDGEGL